MGDENDNIPMFISLLNGTSVAEDAPPGTVVVTIKVYSAYGKNTSVGEEEVCNSLNKDYLVSL